jgi:hypothetical protein
MVEKKQEIKTQSQQQRHCGQSIHDSIILTPVVVIHNGPPDTKLNKRNDPGNKENKRSYNANTISGE